MNFSTKQKQSYRCGRQIYSHQGVRQGRYGLEDCSGHTHPAKYKRDNVRKTDIINHLDTLTAKKPRHIKQKSEVMDSKGKNKSS